MKDYLRRVIFVIELMIISIIIFRRFKREEALEESMLRDYSIPFRLVHSIEKFVEVNCQKYVNWTFMNQTVFTVLIR